jgi:hypothetical protein
MEQRTSVRHIRGSVDAADLFHAAQLRAEPSVHAEDLVVHERRDGQAVERVREHFPQLDVVAPLALVVEAVDAVDAGALVVAAEDEEVLGVLDLVR